MPGTTTQYYIKIVLGIAAFIIWLLSVMTPPIISLQSSAQAVLFGAFVVAFGWGVVQGASAVGAVQNMQESRSAKTEKPPNLKDKGF